MTAVFSKRKKIERNEQARMNAPGNLNPQVNVTAENMLLPFSRYGVVHKVIVWSKQDKTDVQALVQYAEPKYAQYALEEMDGTHIGEFKVMLKYSEKQEIEVNANNERCRDF